MAYPAPTLVDVPWPSAYRATPAKFPPIDLFESLYDSPEELAIAYALEGLTNDRLVAEAGHLSAVPSDEWVTGPGASPIMAAFTHIGHASRFTDGHFGIYYAADSEATAIAETSYHKAKFLSATNEPDMELTLRMYVNRIEAPLLDIRAPAFAPLHHQDSYAESQPYGHDRRTEGANGLLYPSVRNPAGLCVAVFRPKALTIPVHGKHLRYLWDGKRQRFSAFLEIRSL